MNGAGLRWWTVLGADDLFFSLFSFFNGENVQLDSARLARPGWCRTCPHCVVSDDDELGSFDVCLMDLSVLATEVANTSA